MTINEVIKALERVTEEYRKREYRYALEHTGGELIVMTKGGYYRVGNIAVKIAEITEIKDEE